MLGRSTLPLKYRSRPRLRRLPLDVRTENPSAPIHTNGRGTRPCRFLSFADLAIGFSQAPSCDALMAAMQVAAARGGIPMEVYT